MFEPATEVIRKGKAGKPNEFGTMVKVQETENQIIINYAVYHRRPNDADLLVSAIEAHQAKHGCTPRLVAADTGFYSSRNEAAAKAMGVKRVCIPNRSTKSLHRQREQKKPWFRKGQKWRTGCEGRISVIRRRPTSSGAATRAATECTAGSGSASSPTILVNHGRHAPEIPP